MGRRLLIALPLVVAVGLASSARGTDGVLEISQTCALAGGCFSGDGVGFPVDVTSSGSYRLTSNLIVPDENTTGILISASAVTIDLNGFEIVRSGCEGATLNCTPPAGTGSGIAASSATQAIAVRNGTITGMGNFGVLLFEQAEMLNLRVRWNAGHGVNLANGSIAKDSSSLENGLNGFGMGGGATIARCVAYKNGGVGIGAGDGSNVIDNTVQENGGTGLSLSPGVRYWGNVLRNNGGTVSNGVDAGSNVCNGVLGCP
jgi:hypothetical protein